MLKLHGGEAPRSLTRATERRWRGAFAAWALVGALAVAIERDGEAVNAHSGHGRSPVERGWWRDGNVTTPTRHLCTVGSRTQR